MHITYDYLRLETNSVLKLALNAQMRRIDLICKLIGPLFIALIHSTSAEAAILVNLGMNTCSVVIEYFSIAKVWTIEAAFHPINNVTNLCFQVYDELADLRKPKHSSSKSPTAAPERPSLFMRIRRACSAGIQQTRKDFEFYFKHEVFLPSFAGALLYLTVLSFAGQMVTWLLSAGYNSRQIAIARTLSVVFEVLATWVAPWLMGRIGPIRAGLWLASWQVSCLVGGMVIFLKFASHPLISASGIVGGTILSRLGLRGFDLCTQILVQEVCCSPITTHALTMNIILISVNLIQGVEAEARGSFSSTESAWQNFFEICSFASTIIFSRPHQFKYPTIISVVAVGLASLLYAIFVRIKRGHLLHLPIIFTPTDIQRSRERGLIRISSTSDI